MSKSSVEHRDIPGVGLVIATIKFRTRADGAVIARFLHDPRTADGDPVENEDLQVVKAAFNAY